jgi:hypothetical protein
MEKILSDDRFYSIKKGGPGTQVKAAEKFERTSQTRRFFLP